jgi:murein tripeptide amidase MpaA
MTRDDTIRMAREAGWKYADGDDGYAPLWEFGLLLEAKVRKECAELCRAEANGRSPLAFDALHECADLILEGYEE